MKCFFKFSTILFIILFVGCSSKYPANTNVVVINNSPTDLISLIHTTYDSAGSTITNSGGATYADNSLIKPGDEFTFSFESNYFSVGVTDTNQVSHESQQFHINFSQEKNLPIKISATLSPSGVWSFKRIN